MHETINNKWEEIIIKLLYLGYITKRLVEQLNKTLKDTGLDTTVSEVFKGEKKINNYFTLKDKIPGQLQSNIVYIVKYLDCEAEYFRKTTLHSDTR